MGCAGGEPGPGRAHGQAVVWCPVSRLDQPGLVGRDPLSGRRCSAAQPATKGWSGCRRPGGRAVRCVRAEPPALRLRATPRRRVPMPRRPGRSRWPRPTAPGTPVAGAYALGSDVPRVAGCGGGWVRIRMRCWPGAPEAGNSSLGCDVDQPSARRAVKHQDRVRPRGCSPDAAVVRIGRGARCAADGLRVGAALVLNRGCDRSTRVGPGRLPRPPAPVIRATWLSSGGQPGPSQAVPGSGGAGRPTSDTPGVGGGLMGRRQPRRKPV